MGLMDKVNSNDWFNRFSEFGVNSENAIDISGQLSDGQRAVIREFVENVPLLFWASKDNINGTGDLDYGTGRVWSGGQNYLTIPAKRSYKYIAPDNTVRLSNVTDKQPQGINLSAEQSFVAKNFLYIPDVERPSV